MTNKEVKPEAVKEAVKPEFDKEELLKIFDDIIFAGEYEEERLIKGKLKVTFKSRTADDIAAITKEVDVAPMNLVTSMQEKRAFLNLVYSIKSYAGKDLSKSNPDERKKFLGQLPGVIVAALSDSLYSFDKKIDAACSEGEQNF